MCIIIIKDRNKELPKKEWLKNSEAYNRDGIGVCYRKEGASEVIIKKDFKNADQLNDWMHSNITKDDQLIIHFRLATHGNKDEGNRHPFPLTKNLELLTKTNLSCRYALAHNGIISQCGTSKTYSDTQKFVFGVMAEDSVKEHLGSQAIVTLIENFIGNDKLAILKHDGTIYLFGEYVEEAGLLFSNTSYKQAISYYTPTTRTSWLDNVNWGKCDGCGKYVNTEYKEIKHKGTTYQVSMCQECKKKYNKKKTNFFNNESCENCGDTFKRGDLTQTQFGLICKKCYREHKDIIGGATHGDY